MTDHCPTTLTGVVGPREYFRFEERGELDWDVWFDVLSGKIIGAVFRNILSPEACESIQRNFWSSSLLERSPDGLPLTRNVCGGRLAKSSSLSDYLDEVEHDRPLMEALFTGAGRVIPELVKGCASHLARRGIRMRVAEHKGRQAGGLKVKSWGCDGTYVLFPHTDAFPLWNKPHLRDFEIQHVLRYYSALACLRNDSGGELVLWNVAPDENGIRAMRSGPDPLYPEEVLSNFDRLTVPIYTGDVYLFDSGRVHAVGPLHDEQAVRCTAQWTMGVLDDANILRWV